MTPIERLEAHIASLELRICDLESAAKVIKRFSDPASVPDAMREVILKHCLAGKHTMKQMLGHARDAKLCKSRSACWSELWPQYSLTQIGNAFGRHHSTVLVGIRRHRKSETPEP